jgi:hypothetical protein
MTMQPEITVKMRKTLFVWLLQVGLEFHLEHDTISQTLLLIDRLSSTIEIKQSQYQLVGRMLLTRFNVFMGL